MVEVAETKTGFKQTEVGLIPEDWMIVSYGEAFDFLKTATYSRAELAKSGDVGYIHYGDIHTKWEHFLDLSKEKLPHIGDDKVKGYSLAKEGDLVLADASEDYEGVGASVEIINVTNKKLIAGLHTFLLRDNKELFAPYYKAYIHKNEMVKSQFDRLATGLKVYGISKTNLKLILIPLPPTLAEQTAIATALSDMDALIQAQEQLIAKKRAIKQGAMQELLKPKEGDALSGESKGWEVKTVGDCANVVGGGTPSSFNNKFWNGTINWFTPTEVGDAKYLSDSLRKITEDGYSNCSAKMLPIGSVLLTSRAGIGDLGILTKQACTNQGFQSLIPKENTDGEFLYYLIATLKNKLLQNASGSTFLEISPGKLKAIEISTPDKKEQTRIAKIISDMDTEIEQLETQLAKYRQVKVGMMQELLTGKKRLV